ncbi:MAG: DnaA regulatory inactivator Hda [Gammaproteobacteria bacterium]|nr:DnaA regulatory inactivator Hda [Gammaproteobacteria bacterium]
MNQPLSGGQIPLQFGFRETADFEHFIEGPNSEVCTVSRSIALGETLHSIYLWGQVATGKSHLLQAVCNLASQNDLNVAYIPLSQHAEFSPEMLEGLENLAMVCVDDVDCIAGQEAWEQALFHLYNRLREQQKPILMTGSTGPRDLAFQLQDLKSRVSWDLTYHLQALSDKDKIKLLQKRANTRNFEIPEEVAAYLVKNVKRDLPSLLELLDKLDLATLTEQRKLTIPFVKTLIQN